MTARRVALISLGVCTGIGLGLLSINAYDRFTNPFEEEGVRASVRQIAMREGIEEERLETSYARIGTLTDQDLNDEVFAEIMDDLYSENLILQSNAIATLSRLHGTRYADRAIEEIKRVPKHPTESIRQQYIWYLAQTGAESWEGEAQRLLDDPDPEVRRLARKALDNAELFNSRSRSSE